MFRSRAPHRKMLTVVLAILGAVAAATPASGASSNRAEVVHASQCETFDDGTTFCSESHSVLKGFTNPSGNGNIVQHIRFDNSFTGPGCTDTSQGFSRNHLLSKEGTTEEFHFAFKNHSTFDCAGVTRDCVTMLSFHFANDDIQFTREETVCTDPF